MNELLNEDTDMVPKEAPLIVLDSKYDMCMAKNGKDIKHTRNIARKMHLVRNGASLGSSQECMVCLVSLPLLAMHMADLLSKTIKGASFGTMSGSLFINS